MQRKSATEEGCSAAARRGRAAGSRLARHDAPDPAEPDCVHASCAPFADVGSASSCVHPVPSVAHSSIKSGVAAELSVEVEVMRRTCTGVHDRRGVITFLARPTPPPAR
jgi:hypothetical protein